MPATLPVGKRRMALDLQVRKSFPFKQPGFAAHWRGTEATVYAWDAAVVRAAQDAAGVPSTAQVVPETFIRPQGGDGPRLMVMLEGCEGQLWTGGFLRASRWWPHVPSSAEWTKFLRMTGSATSEVDPEIHNLAFLERPWTEGTFSLEDWSTLLESPRAIAIAATAALCPFMFIGTQIALVSFEEGRVRTAIATLDSANQGIRRDRAQAYASLDAIEDVLKLDEYPDQAEVLPTVITRLGEIGTARILSWSFDRGNLEVILRGSQDLDPTAYITLFERDPLFEGVSGTYLGQERDLQLRMAVAKRPLQ